MRSRYNPSYTTLIFHRDKRNIERETAVRSIFEKHDLSIWHFFPNHLTSQQRSSREHLDSLFIMRRNQTRRDNGNRAKRKCSQAGIFCASVKLAHVRGTVRGAFEGAYSASAASDALFPSTVL